MELDPRGAAGVLTTLAAIEARDGVPRIEAAELRRLAAHAAVPSGRPPGGPAGGPAEDDPRWTPHLVDGWYLGLRRRRDDGTVVGEAGRLDGGPVTAPLTLAADHDAGRVWLRGADPADVAAAAAAGWRERRRLLVLGRTLAGSGVGADVPGTPRGLRLAPLAEVGPAAVARLLDRAYAGPRSAGLVEADADAGPWTAERFTRVAAVALADAADLLLAVDGDGALVGAHWTGRRAGGVGEVFNLAVDPDHIGRGIGAWLLAAGLAHLVRLGHHAAVLWVDHANAPARALYARAGFTERGWDVALAR